MAAQAIGADFAYIGSPFIATPEANCSEDYRKAIVESGAADIVNSDLFTGIPGNYLRSSIVRSGLDPDALGGKAVIPTVTEFGSAGSSKTKAWRDIWGSGQGIGAIHKAQPTADYIAQLGREYEEARARVAALSPDR
jgi:nitronate monooxygenase